MKISVGLVDDHQLFLKSLGLMIENFDECKVAVMAMNGKELQERISSNDPPDIILIDVSMPVMDGIDTAKWLTQNYPFIKLVALSMNDSDRIIIEMIKAGCCAYLLKDTHPNELEKAIHEIYTKGFYNSDVININYRRLLQEQNDPLNITENEKLFLQLACSDLTYKQIGIEMHLSERTIDGYRENLFHKFKVQSRVGLVLEAIRKNCVKLNP